MEEKNIYGEIPTAESMAETMAESILREKYDSLKASDLERYLASTIQKPKIKKESVPKASYESFDIDDIERLVGKPKLKRKPKVQTYWSNDPPKEIKSPTTYYEMDGKVTNIGYDPFVKKKSKFTLEECIETLKELQHKEIGDIYLTGSVGLYLQDKLDRDEFKDLDLALVGKLELDDDMKEFHREGYPDDPQCEKRKSVIFNDIPIDIFMVKDPINKVVVNYEGTEFVCQHYKDIVQAKLNMVLEKLKDKDYLLNNLVEIKIL